MVIGDIPPLLDPDEAPRAPRGPFCMPLRTSMRPTIASLESLESHDQYQSPSTTRVLGESVKIYFGGRYSGAIRFSANHRRAKVCRPDTNLSCRSGRRPQRTNRFGLYRLALRLIGGAWSFWKSGFHSSGRSPTA